MKKYIFLLFGMLFGFTLSRAGATTYDFYAKLFLFQDLQLLWVIACAAGIGAIGIAILKATQFHSLFEDQQISFSGKPYKKSLIPGALLLGMGWGLAGACPGTALVMLGEGKLGAGITIFGMVAGTYFYGLRASQAKSKKTATSNLRGPELAEEGR